MKLFPSICVLVALTTGVVSAAERTLPQERPAFMTVETPTEVSRMAEGMSGLLVFPNSRDLGSRVQVQRVVSGSSSDLVLLNAGYRQNFRPGMVCLVEQAGRDIAALIIADSTADRAVALILELAPRASIKAGDTAKIKTRHFN